MSKGHWEYCGKCYTSGFGTYPFGYCKECWIKAGCPKAMKIEGENNNA